MRVPRGVVWWVFALAVAACNSDEGTAGDVLADVHDAVNADVEVHADTASTSTATTDASDATTTTDSALDSAEETVADTFVADADEADSAPETAPETLVDSVVAEVDGDVEDGDGVAEETETALDTAPPVYDCNDNVGLQPAFETLTGFTGSEDFAFDRAGNRYSVDDMGNLVREHHDASAELVLPSVSNFAAGMGILPGGDLVIADAENNTVLRVTVNDDPVTAELLLGGLSYPNGLDVDPDDYIYVAEQNAGRVRRIDARSGASTIIATGLNNPNGVSFAPGYNRLYVGSFGSGTVTAIDRDGDGNWGAPHILFTIPVITPPPELDLCARSTVGGWCYTPSSLGGKCEMVDAVLSCVPGDEPLLSVCRGRNDGDPCRVRIEDTMHSGVCSTQDFGEMCYIDEPIDAGCKEKPVGAPCFGYVWGSPVVGTCHDAALAPPEWGLPPTGMACINEGMWSQRGGMDGLNVDACGTVYVTEYIQGLVWRFDPGATEAIVAASLPSQWIPNMHWGIAGAWDAMTLYVSDRDQGRVFGLALGRPGKQTTVSWE